MHSIRPRPICRAHNTFSPAIALWQHVVAPAQQLTGRPLKSSFATEAAQTDNDDSERPNPGDSNADTNAKSFRKSDGSVARPVKTKNTLVRTSNRTPDLNFELKSEPGGLRRFARFRDYQADGSASRKDDRIPGKDVEKLLKAAYDAYDASRDYEGAVVYPIPQKFHVRDYQLPWNIRQYKDLRPDQKLNLEIQKFHEYVRPNAEESVARKHVIEQVRQHVRQYLPGYVLEVFGSERTGLSFAQSDIDLRLVPKSRYQKPTEAQLPPTHKQRLQMRAALRKLHARLLSKHKDSYLLPVMRWARYPLISLQDRESALDIQIVLSNDTSLGRQFIQRYQEEYPYLNAVYSVMKAALDVRGLSDVFQGGVGSYPLFMMVVASLKHRQNGCNDAQTALLNFLDFWGNFESSQHGLSIEPPKYLAKDNPIMSGPAMAKKGDGRPPWMLNLRDPADETNDLGRKTIAWKHIQATFRSLDRCLRKDLEGNQRPSLLAPFVREVYHPQQRAHRTRLRNYGQSLSEGGRQYTPSDLSKEAAEHTDAMTDDTDIMPGEPLSADHGELDAIAKSIRKIRGPVRMLPLNDGPVAEAEAVSQAFEAANKQSLADIERAREAAKIDDVQGIKTWLKDVEQASEHKQTGEAFAHILGLNKKGDK